VSSNFRLEISGLDASLVIKIDAFTVRHRPSAGPDKDPSGRSSVDVSNLRVEVGPPSRAEAWRTWFETFVLRGNSGVEEEKTGTLTLLSSDLKTSLAQIALYSVGIFGLEGAGRETRRRPVA
jgi:hypothetical protein